MIIQHFSFRIAGFGTFVILAAVLLVAVALADEVDRSNDPDPGIGFELLTKKAYVAPAFDQETFDEIWTAWEEPLRTWAAAADAESRRKMAFRRYGFTAHPDDPARPLQYVVSPDGQWTINCLACHQGSVAGRIVPGVANTRLALETLTEDVRKTKLRLGKAFTDMDLGSLVMPLGTTIGATNAVVFGVALLSLRDEHMNLRAQRVRQPLLHHDMDAPAWWNIVRKERLYCDNFAPRGHRMLMQFIATQANGPDKFREWAEEFRHIESYIESLKPPNYPFAIDEQLADQGRKVFERSCAECHGTYDSLHDGTGLGSDSYPEIVVPIEEIGTDPVRLAALTPEGRMGHERSWLNEYGARGEVIADPGGYLAPPLHGIWASAPYFHNGSVPTLWHVLHPGARPTVWARADNQNDPDGLNRSEAETIAADFDVERVGLAVRELNTVPDKLNSADRRRYFDSRRPGKSRAGHEFPSVLSLAERRAVLEYLKTL